MGIYLRWLKAKRLHLCPPGVRKLGTTLHGFCLFVHPDNTGRIDACCSTMAFPHRLPKSKSGNRNRPRLIDGRIMLTACLKGGTDDKAT